MMYLCRESPSRFPAGVLTKTQFFCFSQVPLLQTKSYDNHHQKLEIMKNKLEIKPLTGFGDIKFGATQAEVEAILGPPQETESIDVEGEIHEVMVWSYWEKGHAVYFEKEQNDVCTNFETDNEEALLFGERVFHLDEKAIIELMQKNAFGEFEIEDDEELDERILFFNDAHLQFVFEDEKLALVSWAVAMDDDEKILWP